MEITKELLEKKLKDLMTRKEQAIAQANAVEGGIITVRGLLGDLDRKGPKSEKPRKGKK